MAIRITGISSGMDTDSMVKELVGAYRKKGESFTKEQTKIEWKQEAWTDLNKKIKSFFTKYASNMRFSSSYLKKSTTVSDTTKASIVAGDNAVSGTQTLKITNLAKAGYLTGAKLNEDAAGNKVEVTGSTKLSDLGYTSEDVQKMSIGFGKKNPDGTYSDKTAEFEIDKDTTISEFVKLVNDSSSKINASFDEANGRIFINSTKSGEANDFSFIGGAGLAGITDALGLTGSGSHKVAGEDATITLNGVDYTSDTNTFAINGLTITAKELTTGEGVSLTTDTDYDGVYKNIKDFFKEYNSLINEIDKLYGADSAKGYEPLTSEEKEAMSEEEVEKWETKIKDSLLRYDSDLNTLFSAMKSSMIQSFDINGTKYSLSSFGISTLGYFTAEEHERNAFHIDGDEDDSETSGNKDRLKAMIASNPEDTAEFFQKLVGGLYKAMNTIQSNSDTNTSYGSFYSDKKIKNDITEQKKVVSDWEKKVSDIEERYYKQFAAMESAMTKLNSQQSYLASLFGGGNN